VELLGDAREVRPHSTSSSSRIESGDLADSRIGLDEQY